MAERRTYERDRRDGSRRPVAPESSESDVLDMCAGASHMLRVGRVGPGGEYAGVHVGAKLGTRRRGEYYVGVSAGREIATPCSPY